MSNDLWSQLMTVPDQNAGRSVSSRLAAVIITRLTSAGTPRNQIHVEDFGWSEP